MIRVIATNARLPSYGVAILAVLVLVAFGACLVHDEVDVDDHGVIPHACAAMLIGGFMVGLLVGPVSRLPPLELVLYLYDAPRRLLDPPPKSPSLV